jgi:hypothetical protein
MNAIDETDSEIDLSYLPNCRPESGFLERYLQDTEKEEFLTLRAAYEQALRLCRA